MATRILSFEEILEEKPTLDELCEHIHIGSKWYHLGIQLKLNSKKLEDIHKLPDDSIYKTTKMFELWLDTKPDATRRQVINALRKEEITVAHEYEQTLRKTSSLPTRIDIPRTEASTIFQSHTHILPQTQELYLLRRAPIKHELLNLLADIADNWYEIGVSLMVSQSVLNGLRSSQLSNSYKLDQVIGIWLTTTESHLVTWETVTDAIKSPFVNNIKKATEIHEYLTRGMDIPRTEASTIFQSHTHILPQTQELYLLRRAPTKHELLNLLADIADNWYEIGVSLMVSQSVLNGLRSSQLSNSYKLDQVIESWLTTTESHLVTWETVTDAIKSPFVNNIKKATEIHEHLNREDIDIPSSRKRKQDVKKEELELKHEKPDLNTAQMFRKYSDRFSPLTLPVGIVNMLYDERVISKETLDKVSRLGGVIGEGPLRALCTTVYEDPNKLKVFANVLLKSEQTVPVDKDILKEYEKTFPSRVNLQRTYQYDFDQMIMTFGSLIKAVSPLIEAGIPSLKNLKAYFQRCFQELRPKISLAKSFDDVMELVQDNCTITNICCLEAIVDHYNITGAKPYITEFKTAVDKFCEKIKTDICLKQSFKIASFSHNLTCETIEFVLEWETDKYRLRHITGLLAKAFEDMAKSVQVKTIYGERFDKATKLEVRSNEATNEELKVVLQQKQREIDDLVSTKEALEEELQGHKMKILEISSVTESKESELKQLLETRTEMNRAKILQIEQLTNTIKEKEVFEKELLSVSVERQRETETLQETITTLTLQLRERDKQIEELKQSLKALEEELDTLKKKILEMSSVTESKESKLKQLLETSTKMNRAKIVQMEQLTNTIKRKETTEKELLSVSAERERELDTLQEIVTSLTLQLREKEKQIEELKQSLKDLAFIPKVHKQLTDKIIEDTLTECNLENYNEVSNLSAVQITEKELLSVSNSEHNNYEKTLKLELRERDRQIEELKQSLKEMKQSNIEDFSSFLTEREVTIEDHLQEESTQSSERDKLIEELQQSVLLKALDLAVIPKAQDLLTNEGLDETQTKTREEESTLSNKEKKELKEDPFGDDHDIFLSSTSNIIEESVDQQNTEHNTFTLQLRERDKQIEELKQSLKEMRQMRHEDLASYLNQMEGNLRGVIPAGDTLFLLRGSSQPQFFNWEKYGLSLSAPEGILPPSETCEVAITALAGGEFEFPKGNELVSAVYVISISKPLLKPLTINIQHCVALETPEQCNSLQFMKAPLNNGIPPYQFEIFPGGHFSPGNQYGSISCAEFSLFGLYLELEDIEDNAGEGEGSTSDDNSQQNEDTHISEENDLELSYYEELEIKESNEICDDMDLEVQEIETKTENLEDDAEVRHKPLQNNDTTVSTSQNITAKQIEKADILYYCKVYYEEKATFENEWEIMFTVVKHLNALQQYIKRCHPHAKEGQKIDFVLKAQNDIEFDIKKYHHEIPQGWEILPHMEPLKVKYTAIKMFGSTGHPEPPSCLVDVCADLGPDTAKRLHYKVPVLGAEWNVDLFINLFLRQKSVQITTTHHSDQMMNHGAQASVPEHQSPMENVMINQQSTDIMVLNSRKRPRGDEEISENESKQKREKHDCSDSINSPAIITSDNLKGIKGIIQDALTQWHSDLSKVLKKSLEKIATDLYSHGLISEAVNESPTFKDIMTEFQSGMNLIRNYQRLVKHCELFLQTLVDQHGPPKEAAINIAEDWTENIKRKLNITIEFNIIV